MSTMLTIPNYRIFDGYTVFITGGTGSLGKKLTYMLLENSTANVVIFSRDEFKQFMMADALPTEYKSRVKFVIGDVRDYERVLYAMENCQFVIHAAALKHVPLAEDNPMEFIRTNVLGAENVINSAIKLEVQKVVALSTDKASNPINLYGATKLCSDKLFVSANNRTMPWTTNTKFSVVRYGNVVGSRGSVIPFFLKKWMEKTGEFPITDPRMTRFWITIEQGASLVLNSFSVMNGGEIYVPKIPSMRVTDLCTLLDKSYTQVTVGIRPGEKLHECMISVDDGRLTYECDDHYIVTPNTPKWVNFLKISQAFPHGKTTDFKKKCPADFYYGSDNNSIWLTDAQTIDMIKACADDGDKNAEQWLKQNDCPVCDVCNGVGWTMEPSMIDGEPEQVQCMMCNK